ncbi:MAG: hypothetical protein ACI37Z_02740 [Candidatus Gastranaerophilaceae bacterium]
MDMNTNLLNIELEAGLNTLLDTCLGYVENVLVSEEIMEANSQMML